MGVTDNTRWLAALTVLAERRGCSPAVRQRATGLCRQFGFAPWVALAVAEGLVPLPDAAALDRAAKCKELQNAVLYDRRPLAELRRTMPFAPYFIAADLLAAGLPGLQRMSDALLIAGGLLAPPPGVPALLPGHRVDLRPPAEYATAARRITALARNQGLPLMDALDVETGRMPLPVAQRRAAIARADSRWRSDPRGAVRGGPPRPARDQDLRQRGDQHRQAAHQVER